MGNIVLQDWAISYIKHVLEKTGWSATRLAQAAKISSSTITRPLATDDWPHKISRNTIAKIWKVSGIDPEPFANEAGELYLQGTYRHKIVATVDPEGNVLAEADKETNESNLIANEDQIRIEIFGERAIIRATVGKEGLDELLRKIGALRELLD